MEKMLRHIKKSPGHFSSLTPVRTATSLTAHFDPPLTRLVSTVAEGRGGEGRCSEGGITQVARAKVYARQQVQGAYYFSRAEKYANLWPSAQDEKKLKLEADLDFNWKLCESSQKRGHFTSKLRFLL